MSTAVSRRERRRSRIVAREPQQAVLPAWPLAWLFVGYPVWWLLGIGELSWALAGVVMAALLIRSRRVVAPRGFGLVLAFLLWVALSAVAVDTVGRLLGFGFRFVAYIGVAVIFLYIFNARQRLPLDRVLGYLTVLWGWVVMGGYLGLFFPGVSVRTPLSYVLPEGLLSNELISGMVIRRFTQFNPDAWFVIDPRPTAPFLYTNNWGNAYSLLLPLVLLYIVRLGAGWQRRVLIVAAAASLVPAFLTLNRGMFLGLAVVLVVVLIRLLLQGRVTAALVPIGLAVVAVVTLAFLPVWDRLETRLGASSTNEDRVETYVETVLKTLQSPLLGYGYPRPTEGAGFNPLGTQGQVWMVLFSHGFVGLALFLAVLIWMLLRAMRADSLVGIVVSGVLVALCVEIFYYGVNGVGLAVAFTAAALVMRDARLSHPDRPVADGAWETGDASRRR